MTYIPWTSGQEEMLRANAHMGARMCRDLIYEEYGIYREIEATKRHALRIGVSLRKYEICPKCGGRSLEVEQATGFCKVCFMKSKVRQEKALQQQMRREALRKENHEYSEARRQYLTLQRANQRFAKTNNLPNKRQRKAKKNECPQNMCFDQQRDIHPANGTTNGGA